MAKGFTGWVIDRPRCPSAHAWCLGSHAWCPSDHAWCPGWHAWCLFSHAWGPSADPGAGLFNGRHAASRRESGPWPGVPAA